MEGYNMYWKYLYYFSIILHVIIPPSVACPSVCQCSKDGLDAVCANGGLDKLPATLSLQLATLDLHQNKLDNTSLASHLGKYPNLQKLDLGQNEIEELSPGLFSELSNLEELNLTLNQLSLIHKGALANLTTLKTLDLSHNRLSEVNGLVQDISPITFLNLSYNHIYQIEILTFEELSALRLLDLSFNRLTLLDGEVFNGLKSLEELHLQGNQLINTIDILAQWSVHIPSIQYIDISYNLIQTQGNGNFTDQNFPNLQELNVSNNNLTVLTYDMLTNSAQLKVFQIQSNPIRQIEEGVFKNIPLLEKLRIDNCSNLTQVPNNLLEPLANLLYLNLSNNPRLNFLPTSLFDSQTRIETIDISENNLTSLPERTFQHTNKLLHLYLAGNSFTCDCAIYWIKDLVNDNSNANILANPQSLYCTYPVNQSQTLISEIDNSTLQCEAPVIVNNHTDIYYPIGSSAFLSCDVYSIPASVITWVTPRKKVFEYHKHHPDAVGHLLSRADVQPGAKFHEHHPWHNSSSYYSNIPDSQRILLLDDGSLYIDYVQRQDGGPYQCIVKHPKDNLTMVFTLHLDHSAAQGTKIMSIIIGFALAGAFFVLAMIIWAIKVAANRCINQQKREAIKNIIDNLDAYKTLQLGRIKDIGANQMGRFRDTYHFQLERLRENYNQQMLRIRENCGQQMDKIRDNYATHVGRLKDYSSNRLERLRDNYNTQIVRIREYGSLQLDRLRENYKLQQQHLIKLLETMNIDNCKTVIETDCVRAESMLFDSEVFIEPLGELPYLLEADINSSCSGSDLDFVTASSNSDSTSNREHGLLDMEMEVYTGNEMKLEEGVVIQMPPEMITEDGRTYPPDMLLPPAPILPLPKWDSDSESEKEASLAEQIKRPQTKRHRRRKARRQQQTVVEIETLLPDPRETEDKPEPTQDEQITSDISVTCEPSNGTGQDEKQPMV